MLKCWQQRADEGFGQTLTQTKEAYPLAHLGAGVDQKGE